MLRPRCSDESGSEHCLADSGWRYEDADVLREESTGGLFLDGCQRAAKAKINSVALVSLVMEGQRHPVGGKKSGQVWQTTPGQGYMLGGCSENSSVQKITRGVIAVDSRIFCFL